MAASGKYSDREKDADGVLDAPKPLEEKNDPSYDPRRSELGYRDTRLKLFSSLVMEMSRKGSAENWRDCLTRGVIKASPRIGACFPIPEGAFSAEVMEKRQLPPLIVYLGKNHNSRLRPNGFWSEMDA